MRERRCPPLAPLAGAEKVVHDMEGAVAYRTVTPDFTVEDVKTWLWPREVIDTLTLAYDYADTRFTTVHVWNLLLPAPLSLLVNFRIELKGMLAPSQSAIQITRSPRIEKAFEELAFICAQFNKVRRVIMWLNANATVGYARYVCPQLGALLPQDHPFHKAGGVRFKEPRQDVAPVADDIRECGRIIATGIMASPTGDMHERKIFKIQIHRGDNLLSQRFSLL